MNRVSTTVAGVAALILLTSSFAQAGPGEAGHAHGSDAAYGKPGDPKKPARMILVTMKEAEGKMLYLPDKIKVKRGEQVRFKLQNSGELEHEFVIGTVEDNAKHKVAMEKNPDMEHDDPNAKRVQPKKADEIVWQFTNAGTFEYACLIPGHYEAGMKGTIVVK